MSRIFHIKTLVGLGCLLCGLVFASESVSQPVTTYIATVTGSIKVTVDRQENKGDRYVLSGTVTRKGISKSYTRPLSFTPISEDRFKVSGLINPRMKSSLPKGTAFTQTIDITGKKGAIISGYTDQNTTYVMNVQRINQGEFEITGNRTTDKGFSFSTPPIRVNADSLFDASLGFDPAMLHLLQTGYRGELQKQDATL